MALRRGLLGEPRYSVRWLWAQLPCAARPPRTVQRHHHQPTVIQQHDGKHAHKLAEEFAAVMPKFKPYAGKQPVAAGQLLYPFAPPSSQHNTAAAASSSKPLLTLAFESTCDETAVSVVSSDRRVHSHALAQQNELVHRYQGVWPAIAAIVHQAYIPHATAAALLHANLTMEDIDFITVAAGPGLAPALQVTMKYSKALAAKQRLPIVAVNHIEAHATVASLLVPSLLHSPHLVLLLSGGNSVLWHAQRPGQQVILGDTHDIAFGLAMDRAAKHLQLSRKPNESYAAAMERTARNYTVKRNGPTLTMLTEPLLQEPGCNMSFAGLVSQFERLVKKRVAECQATSPADLSDTAVAQLCAAYQYVATEHVLRRTETALQYMQLYVPTSQHLVFCGGVSCNQYLRQRLAELCARYEYTLVVPPVEWCTDNAVMIGWSGLVKYALGQRDTDALIFQPTWEVGPRVDVHQFKPLFEESNSMQRLAQAAMRPITKARIADNRWQLKVDALQQTTSRRVLNARHGSVPQILD